MAKKKKGIVSARVAEERAIKAKRKKLMAKAKRGDQGAVAELIAGGERVTPFWRRLIG